MTSDVIGANEEERMGKYTVLDNSGTHHRILISPLSPSIHR